MPQGITRCFFFFFPVLSVQLVLGKTCLMFPFSNGIVMSYLPLDTLSGQELCLYPGILHSYILLGSLNVCVCVCVCVHVRAQSCLTLYNPMDCSLPGTSVHGTSQPSLNVYMYVCMCVCVCVCVRARAQLCPTLCNPMDSSLPGTSVHGTSQARILEWVAVSYSKGSNLSLLHLLHWQADSLPLHHPGKLRNK